MQVAQKKLELRHLLSPRHRITTQAIGFLYKLIYPSI